MKNLKTSLVVFGMFFVLASPVRAMEGTASLGSKDDEMGSCFAASVFFEDRYRVLMTCRGLRSALDPVKNKYVAWVKKGENLRRLGEIVNGKLRARVDEDFEKIEITAEADGYPSKPEGEVLLSGNMEGIVFNGKKIVEEEVIVVVDEIDDRGAVTPEVTEDSSDGNIFKIVGKALLTGFLVLLGVVGVLSFVSRRKKEGRREVFSSN